MTACETKADWPGYRGPKFDGHAGKANENIGLPVTWSEESNVVWKTAIPQKGWSTPAISADRIWLTTASEDGHDFYVVCSDFDNGQILVNKKLFHSDKPEPLGNDMNSYASPSPVLEKDRVYLHFGSYGTACLDAETAEPVWQRTDLPCRHYRGPASSPVIYKNLLILTMDGVDQQYLVALDKRSGKTVWRTERTTNFRDLDADGKPRSEGDLRKAFSSPIIVNHNGRDEILSVGSRAVFGYNPENGEELWRLHFEGFSAATRPVVDGGVAYITSGFGDSELLAIRLGGNGDLQDNAVLWRTRRGVPRMSSPVLVNGLLYMINDNGILTCLDAEDGSEIWKERMDGKFSASLLYGDGYIYCFDRDGKNSVVRAGRQFELVSSNSLNDGFMASPAVYGKSLVLRTKTHLYRIEELK